MNKIYEFLLKENIHVVDIKNEISENHLIESPAELTITVDKRDIPNWNYFVSRVNEESRIVTIIEKDNTLRFVFHSIEETEKELDIFYNALCKKYYKVNPPKDHFSVLVKPTHRCNLDCKYCYDRPYRDAISADMTHETLDRTVKLLSQYTRNIQFIWHGGEATMLGIDWFKKAYTEVFNKYPMTKFNFHIMSNGINLNDEWLDFFDEFNILCGISYNTYFQNILRPENTGNDSGKKIEDILIRSGTKKNKIGVIDVITGVNCEHQTDIYEYYKKLGISVCMNHIFHTSRAKENNLEVSAGEYAKHFLNYFKYWLYDTDGTEERAAREALGFVIGAIDASCAHQDCRYGWLGINPLGEIYPCDRYYPEKYKIGSVYDFKSISDIFGSKAYQQYVSEIQQRFDTLCTDCGYWFACKGGCNASAAESCGDATGTEQFACLLFRLTFDGVYDILRDVSFLDEKINPVARSVMIEHDFYSIKEIKQYLKEAGIYFPLKYDKNNLLQCDEYAIFRGINSVRDETVPQNRHTNFINSFTLKNKRINKERRKDGFFNILKEVALYAFKTANTKESGNFRDNSTCTDDNIPAVCGRGNC